MMLFPPSERQHIHRLRVQPRSRRGPQRGFPTRHQRRLCDVRQPGAHRVPENKDLAGDIDCWSTGDNAFISFVVLFCHISLPDKPPLNMLQRNIFFYHLKLPLPLGHWIEYIPYLCI